MSNENYYHKQDNFFLFFPIYVCLGVYYIMELLTRPFVKAWDTSSANIYDNLAQNSVNKDLSGAYMNETEKANQAAERAAENAKMAAANKEVTVADSLVRSREKLISQLDNNQEIRSDKIVTYRYTALNPEGKQVKNTFLAFSKSEVYTFLENEGYKVFKIETSPLIEKIYGPGTFSSRRISLNDIVFWLEQLSTYLRAGIPLTDSMRILSRQMGKNRNIKRTFDSIVYNLTLGESFSTCLEKQGDAFPSLLINMVRSAEATGDLEGTLENMARYYKDTETTRKEMVSSLIYPLVILMFSIGVVIFILVYLIPKFQKIYNTAGADINWSTQVIIDLSNFLRTNSLSILLSIALIIIVNMLLYKNIKSFRYFIQSTSMKLPVFGKIIIYKEMMIFTKTFSSLLKNNVFITESMDILGKVTNNEIYRQIMVNTVNCIGRGDKISSSFRDHWAIPEVAYYMMVTGESTGQLAEMMEKVSEYYQEQHKVLVNVSKSLIEPILIVLLSVIVGAIIISVIVPMFSLYTQIK